MTRTSTTAMDTMMAGTINGATERVVVRAKGTAAAGHVAPRQLRGLRRSPQRSMRGVGMIEVLVAVLILGIGLLGIAAMQATALRNSQSSFERSQGVVHVYAIFDAMRANPNAARAGAYNMGMTCAAPANAGTLVNRDQHTWITTLQTNLGPTACGQINCVVDVCTVTVRWDDSRGSGGSNIQEFTTTSRI